jgi:hypothetical protein
MGFLSFVSFIYIFEAAFRVYMEELYNLVFLVTSMVCGNIIVAIFIAFCIFTVLSVPGEPSPLPGLSIYYEKVG